MIKVILAISFIFREALSSYQCIILPDKARASSVEGRDRFFVDAFYLPAASGNRKAFP